MANKDDIWYQDRYSEDWQMINEHTTVYELVNQSKYQYQFRFILNSIIAGGASTFSSMGP